MLDRLRSASLTLCMIVLLGGLAFWVFSLTEGGKSFLGDNFGDGNLPVVDFGTLETDEAVGAYLLCPENYCLEDSAAISPTWAVSADDLMTAVIGHLDVSAELKRARINIPARQFDYTAPVQGRPWPDLVTIRFISLSERLSTVAVYARTEFGKPTDPEDQKKLVDGILLKATNALPKVARPATQD